MNHVASSLNRKGESIDGTFSFDYITIKRFPCLSGKLLPSEPERQETITGYEVRPPAGKRLSRNESLTTFRSS